jgi:hypothetical protein
MIDQSPDAEPAIEDVDAGDVDSGQPDPDGEQDAPLGPTRNTRSRPSALDLARAFD